jgi:hypothetical protein
MTEFNSLYSHLAPPTSGLALWSTGQIVGPYTREKNIACHRKQGCG